ncbi:MAG: threonine--tRNA ligase [Clostridia bacterium]|nr:threonine--tRNA ligase [Clostridia bacterium]
MLKITLRDDVQSFESGITGGEIAKSISEGLYRAALAVKVNGHVSSLDTPITEDATVEILTFDSEEGKNVYRHTASHVLAQAVKRLYPAAKLAIGPAIENGFYYDIDLDTNLSMDDLDAISAEMKKIIKEDLPVRRFVLPREEALNLMRDKNEPYKVELIEDLAEDAELSFYEQGDFTDLCAGPHLSSTGKLKAFKLLSVTGAYWRGNEKNKMLQRIYGTAFPKNADLTAYLEALEEAKKRDHNKIGRDLEYFTTSELIGQGLPIMLPKGAQLMQTLQRFVEDTEEAWGWQRTKTPLMAKSDLYKLSGHWDHYRDGMFILGDPESDDEVFALRPMTCPFQYQAYLNRGRSYRDLPMRLGETSTLFRNEASGEMHGLIRVRQFTISEGHLMCTPEQLEDEFKSCLELANYMLKTIGLFDDVSYRFSQWDPSDREKYIGTDEQWAEAQGIMKKILDNLGINYVIGIGEAAFYGPKLDIQIKNVHGKEDTLITLQVDQMLAEKFGMEYTAADGEKKHPYIIHRTSIGCYERTIALLLEKYAGALPTWMSPQQVRVLPISEKYLDYANEVCASLRRAGVRTEVDSRDEKIGYKIRSAQLEKLPYMLIVGEEERAQGAVAVRSRRDGDKGKMALDAFIKEITEEIATKAR